MLGKLLKYDYKSNLFYFLLMYGVFFAIAIVARASLAMVDLDYAAFQDDVLSVSYTHLYYLFCGC